MTHSLTLLQRVSVVLVLMTAWAHPGFAEEAHDHGHEEPEHLFALSGLEVLHPWTNATSGGDALIFMEIHNEGDGPVTITGVRTKSGLTGELVGFRLSDGEGVYDPLPSIPVGPETHLDLEPGALAIRVSGVSQRLDQGDVWSVELLTSLGPLALDVAVEAADARQHSHAGHAH